MVCGVVVNYCVITTLILIATYGSGLSVRRTCPFDVRALPMPGELGIKRATRVHYRLIHNNCCRPAACRVQCFRPSNGKGLRVSGNAIFLPGSLCPLRGRAFELCCASTSASRRAVSVCIVSDFKRIRRLSLSFGGSGNGRRARAVAAPGRWGSVMGVRLSVGNVS